MPQPSPEQQALLQQCLQAIETRLAWPPTAQWQHQHFELLAQQIQEETGIRLSVATLKRVWGKVAYHSFPAISTLDALAQFAGYEGWIAFQHQQQASSAIVKLPNKGTGIHLPRWIFFLAAGMVIAFSLSLISKRQKASELAISFDFAPLSVGLPNTVQFHYNVPTDYAETVAIQQSWDSKLRHTVKPEGDFFACTYFYPGVFQAKLLLDHEIAVEKSLVIASGGWLGTIERDSIPVYLEQKDLQTANSLHISPTHLTQAGIDLNAAIPRSTLHLVGAFGKIDAHDFEVHTRFRHSLAQGDAICQKSEILLHFSKSPLILPFSIPGCVGELRLLNTMKWVLGKDHDLSGFGVDYRDWVDLRVRIQGQQLQVWVNEALAFEQQFDPSLDLDKLHGIRYRFQGTGEVQSLSIYEKGKSRYSQSF